MTDTLETVICFPTIVYTIKKYEFLGDVYKSSMEALSKVSEEINEIYPVRMSGDISEDPRIADFCKYVALTALNILKEQGYKVNNKAVSFSEMWVQEHHKYSSMDQHVHGSGVHVVGFYFLDVPENSSVATFYDPRPGKVQIGEAEANSNDVSFASNSFHFKPEPGMLLLTNSWLPHAFTRHAGNEPIRFVHFNIILVDNIPHHTCKPADEVV